MIRPAKGLSPWSLLVLLSCLFSAPVRAEQFTIPWLSGPVVDEANLISAPDRRVIESWLRSANDSQVAQVQVLVIDSLAGLPIEVASMQIVEKWQLGDVKKDNGVLFLIAPKERRMRIEVGQGLEGILPDVYAKRIVEDVVGPRFRAGDFSTGIREGVAAILTVVRPSSVPEEHRKVAKRKPLIQKLLSVWIELFFLGFILLFTLMGRWGRRRGSSWAQGTIPYGTGYGGWSGGGGFGGGGGWSGGGGGFSGGGASGSW